jgi:hypothetical protein
MKAFLPETEGLPFSDPRFQKLASTTVNAVGR